MSRIIVKNLPTYITEPTLRHHFSSQPSSSSTSSKTTTSTPELTDVKIVHKKDGSTRRIAFIGYKSEEQAQAAQTYFDKTYLDVSKLRVEIVNGTKDAPIRIRDGAKRGREREEGTRTSTATITTPAAGDRNAKRRRVGDATADMQTVAGTGGGGGRGGGGGGEEGKKQAKTGEVRLEEFQKVMGAKRGVGPSWANEEVEHPGASASASASAAAAATSSRLKKKKKEADDAVNKENEREEEEVVADQGEVSDMEWMRRRMRASQVDDGDMREEKMFEQSDEDEDDRMQGVEETAQEPKAQQPTGEVSSDPTREAILSNGRLFVRNLAFSCTEQELSTHFATFGEIEQVHLPVDTSSNPKGFGYIRFKNPSHALAAYEALDKASFQGRLLHILPGVDRHPKPTEGIGGDPTQPTRLKDVRAQKRKEKSGKEFNWAVLYMNSDAVANSIADRLGIPKADILNPDASGVGGSPAVKLALAETHIIVETKKYLEQNNVDLSLFAQKRLARSKTIILVKNIPYGVASSEIESLFKAYGSVRRVLFPPAGTIAIVEFAEGNEKQAADAWRGVAYKRVKDSILYLEWAPQGLLDGPTPDTINDDEKRPKSFVERRLENATMSSSSSAKKVNVTNEDEGGGGDEEDAAPGATLHIGNLSFATTSERLSSIFRHLPFFAFAKIATKVDPNRPGEKLSQGFGFVGFKTVDAAKQAMKGVSAGGEGGLVLDGHVLKISFAGRGKEEMEKEKSGAGILGQSGKTKGTKVIVKNLAFEVTKKELWELFNAHGQVKSVRLPNRADRRSRGFAFVDFASRKEAENAMEQLRHSHLLGRHLVLDWAKKEQDVDEVRLKTMLEYASASRGGDMGRKEKLRLGPTEDATESDNE